MQRQEITELVAKIEKARDDIVNSQPVINSVQVDECDSELSEWFKKGIERGAALVQKEAVRHLNKLIADLSNIGEHQ